MLRKNLRFEPFDKERKFESKDSLYFCKTSDQNLIKTVEDKIFCQCINECGIVINIVYLLALKRILDKTYFD